MGLRANCYDLSAHTCWTLPNRSYLDWWIEPSCWQSEDVRGKKQLSLAQAQGVEVFGCPAGGCLLTDPVIAGRMKDLFLNCPDWNMQDARLTTFGRHFRLDDRLKVIVGRNEEENMRLTQIGGSSNPRLELSDHPGPLVLLKGNFEEGHCSNLGKLIRSFAKKVKDESVAVKLQQDGLSQEWLASEVATEEEINAWRI